MPKMVLPQAPDVQAKPPGRGHDAAGPTLSSLALRRAGRLFAAASTAIAFAVSRFSAYPHRRTQRGFA